MSHDAKAVRALSGHRRWSAPCACGESYNGLGGKQDAERWAIVHNHVCNALDAAASLTCHCWVEQGDGGRVEYTDQCVRCRILEELRAVA